MKPSLVRASKFILAAFIVSSPLLVFAQAVTDIPSLFSLALNILNDYVVPIIFAIAFIVFLFGIYRYFIAGGGDAEKTKEGRQFLLWSIIGFVLMFSIWGIINLFINSFGFNTASQPAFPTFGAGSGSGSLTTGSSNPFGGLFGSSPSSTSGGLTPGQTVVDPVTGQQYVATGANTVQPVNGTCPTNYTLNGTQCVANSSAGAGAGTGSGAVQPGGTCKTDGDCADLNGQSYGCFQGTCTVDGDAPADGTVPPGGACTNDNSCQDVNGQSYGCSNGLCTPSGDTNTADGTVAPGGSCTSDNNCEDVGGQSYGCFNDVCTADGDANGSGGTACTYGSVAAGSFCVVCSDGTTADTAGDCPSGVDSGSGSGGSVPSQGNTGS